MDFALKPLTENPGQNQPHPARALRVAAHFFSILFHPLLLSSYTIAFLIYLHPSAFVGVDAHTCLLRMSSTVLFTFLYPAIVIFLAWRLKLVRSLSLNNMQDRIVGFMVTMFFYWWTWNVFRNLQDVPPVAVHFALGSFLAICGGWMCNIFFKISMHALGAGGLCAFFIAFGMHDAFASGLYIAVPLLLTGLVCSSRLILGQHTPFEIYIGLLVGALAQWFTWLL
ncbi:MAG: phosphatase PAP2 family protein [Puia sp.]